jgi:hypothetical protein
LEYTGSVRVDACSKRVFNSCFSPESLPKASDDLKPDIEGTSAGKKNKQTNKQTNKLHSFAKQLALVFLNVFIRSSVQKKANLRIKMTVIDK